MTQHADPRSETPMIDTSVDAETTTPAGGTPLVQPSGWPPSGPTQMGPMAPMPPMGPVPAVEPPLNTMSWLSVVAAFVVSPAAIVLGILSRRQIARTGERGRGLATTGIALGAVFTLLGVVSTILVLSMVTTVTTTATTPVAASPIVPAPVASAPASPLPDAGAPSTGGSSTGGTSAVEAAGRAQLLSSWMEVLGAAQTTSASLDQHSGDLDAMQQDFATYRDAVQKFRDDATAASLSPDQRAQVDSKLIPAVDKVLADLTTLSSSQNRSKLQTAATSLDADSSAMVDEATAVIGG